MSATSSVTSQQTTKVHVTWSDSRLLPATPHPINNARSQPSQQQLEQQTSSDIVTPPWPTTSCASSVIKDPRYVTTTPSTTTFTTTAVVHAKTLKQSAECDVSRADSDSDAQIDSMSSSDLENCEELDEFYPSSPAPDALPPLSGARDETTPLEKVRDELSRPKANGDISNTDETSPSDTWTSNDRMTSDDHVASGDQMMSLRDFESLPPMWEDGGTRGVGVAEVDCGPWQMYGGDEQDTVRVFREKWDDGDMEPKFESLEEREAEIEQTLSDIYASPFQDHRQTPATKPARPQSLPIMSNHRHKFTTNTRLILAGIDSDTKPLGETVDNVNGEADDSDEKNEEANDSCPRGPVEEYTSSLARVAERAVSGYRSCDDIESYVGSRQPKLILARAPPSAAGILRRTNRKPAGPKAPPTGVRFADGKTNKPRFVDDVT